MSNRPCANSLSARYCNISSIVTSMPPDNAFTLSFQVFQASARAAASSTPTATKRETPGSCMVTPINLSAACMAILLCVIRSEEHTSELQSRGHLVCRLLLEKKKTNTTTHNTHYTH